MAHFSAFADNEGAFPVAQDFLPERVEDGAPNTPAHPEGAAPAPVLEPAPAPSPTPAPVSTSIYLSSYGIL